MYEGSKEFIGKNLIPGLEEGTSVQKLIDVFNLILSDSESILSKKVDAVTGKGLSTNDFTKTLKEKLDGLSNYSLPTSSATEKGGSKVGKSLKVTNEVLDVNIDGDTIYQDVDGKVKAKQSSSSGGGSNVTTYVHSGNKEVVVSSIDYATNTFTSNSHGLTNGNRVAFNISWDCNILTQTPFSTIWPNLGGNGGWFVINATTNSFQLSLTNGGAPIVLTQRATNDFTKWKIETSPSASSISFNNVNATSLKLSIYGNIMRSPSSIQFNGSTATNGYKDGIYGNVSLDSRYSLGGIIEIVIVIVNGQEYVNYKVNNTELNNNVISMYKQENLFIQSKENPVTLISSIVLSTIKLFNGSKIIIEKIS